MEKAGPVNASSSLTIPSNAREVIISVAIADSAGDRVFQSVFLRAQLTGTKVLFIGGYYYSSSDYGLVNVDLTNGSAVKIRNSVYFANDRKSVSTLTIWYNI